MAAAAAAGMTRSRRLRPAPKMAAAMRLRPAGRPRPEARAPVFVVLDGADSVRRARLLPLLRRLVEDGAVPPHRIALVAADERFETYSASARYARTLAGALQELGPGRRVGVGPGLRSLAPL